MHNPYRTRGRIWRLATRTGKPIKAKIYLARAGKVARLPVIIEGSGVEVLGDDLLTARESVAATHLALHS